MEQLHKNMGNVRHFELMQVLHRLKISTTPKAFFIYNPKVASRFLDHNLPKSGTFFNISNGELELLDSDYTISELGHEYISEILQDWKNIIDHTNKKDIVILYRNPIERLFSGIVQDTWNLLSGHKALVYSTLIQSGFTNSDIDLLLRYYREVKPTSAEYDSTQSSIKFDEYDMDNSITRMVYRMYEIYIENLFSMANFENTHTCPHNIVLVSMLTTLNIDTNKIKFINIDCNKQELIQYLSSIEVNIKPKDSTHSNNSFGKWMVEEIISKINYDRFFDLLKNEIYSYHILESYRIK